MDAAKQQVDFIRRRLLSIIVFLIGITFLPVSLYFDAVYLFRLMGLPTGELFSPWVRADLTTLRAVSVLTASLLIISMVVLWRYPEVVAGFSGKIEVFLSTTVQFPLFIPLSLTTVILMKTVLQLGLYLIGYSAYGADDFSRSLSADYWLYYRRFDLGWEGWLGLGASGWLPFSDYLFGLALAIHRDLYLTPKVVNLFISAIAVLAVYLLGRELFGRTAGFFTACLFAFQPWHVWLGISGMTSDLPSVVLIAFFGVFLVRWLRTDASRVLLTAAGVLGAANGFRYENWLFSAVFSLFVVLVAVSHWKRGLLTRRWVTVAVCAVAIINAFPLAWMIASYVVLGDWLPAFHVTNAWMVGAKAPTNLTIAPEIPLVVNQAPHMAHMNMLVLAIGSFPVELALSIAGVGLFLSSDRCKPVCHYLVVAVATSLLFGALFKGQLSASVFFARFFLPFVVFLLPYAGFFLTRLFMARQPWRSEGLVATYLILLTTAALDIARAFNYPAMFPKDAISAGWTIRNLQETGTISDRGKNLIERATDWGDLGIVVIANRPERFVAINELVYQQMSAQALPSREASTSAQMVSPDNEGVRGTSCDAGFHLEACKNSILQENFNLVILSSPRRVASFQNTFAARSWKIGRYHVFDMSSLPSTKRTVEVSHNTNTVSSQ